MNIGSAVEGRKIDGTMK